MSSHDGQPTSPHEGFARVHAGLHGVIAERLRSKCVQDCLKELVRIAPCDALDRARTFWQSEHWPADSIGPTVGGIAESGGLESTIGWFLAVRSGNTVRAVLPIHNWSLQHERMLVIRPPVRSPLTQQHILKAMHGTINLSFTMRSGGKGGLHKGMLLASLEEELPLYWGDVRPNGRSNFPVTTSDGRQIKFESTAQESEKHLGLASVMYIPLPCGDAPECVLALYSPVPHVFGEADDPIVPANERIPAIQNLVFPADDSTLMTLLQSLRLNDALLGRDLLHVPFQYVLANWASWLNSHPEQLGKLVEQHREAATLTVSEEDIIQVLGQMRVNYRDSLDGSTERRLRIDTGSVPLDSPIESARGAGADVLISVIDDLLKNAWDANDEALLQIDKDQAQKRWRLEISNSLTFADGNEYAQKLCEVYWVARHSHLFQNRSGRGMGVFATYWLSMARGFEFLVDMDVPTKNISDGDAIVTRWRAKITIPLRTC